MKEAFWLGSLLLCLVALSQGQEVLFNGGFDGCPADPAPGWTGGYGTVPPSSGPSLLGTRFDPFPPGDSCCGGMSHSGLRNKMTQSITITEAGKYDFTGLVSCSASGGSGECNYFLTINNIPIALTPNTDPSPGSSGNDFINIQALGIDLAVGSYPFQFSFTVTEFGAYVAISSLSLVFVSGSGSADPHMVGFNGQRFDYIGEPGQVVNILSDPAFQVNALLGLQKQSANMFLDGPVMMEMLFMTRGHTVSINAGGYLKEETGFVKVDGALLPIGQSLSFPDDKISVIFTPLNAIAKDLGLVGDNDHIVAQVDVKLEGLFEFRVFLVENGRDPHNPEHWVTKYPRRFLDFNASLLDQDRRPHGILGQTAAPLSKERSVGEWTIEGKDQDYVVKDGITGTQFAFNQFN